MTIARSIHREWSWSCSDRSVAVGMRLRSTARGSGAPIHRARGRVQSLRDHGRRGFVRAAAPTPRTIARARSSSPWNRGPWSSSATTITTTTTMSGSPGPRSRAPDSNRDASIEVLRLDGPLGSALLSGGAALRCRPLSLTNEVIHRADTSGHFGLARPRSLVIHRNRTSSFRCRHARRFHALALIHSVVRVSLLTNCATLRSCLFEASECDFDSLRVITC